MKYKAIVFLALELNDEWNLRRFDGLRLTPDVERCSRLVNLDCHADPLCRHHCPSSELKNILSAEEGNACEIS